ncbi:hypothetical protein DFP72DRAFT_1003785 [Ephemerocybe angulata]|uniref:Uncharacterized protein n=1 Tax=Ephemerocybe angulata TaxID=980116 RepID=A0A8H6M976_9AGAR|nr:hypothetical protein DFP72DRAFT_1003785 [Tulosesus angulatus]
MSLLHPKVFTLPQELIDSVIDAIEDDTSTLMAVGLVGKQWYRRSRVHLFKQMHLGGRPNPADRLSQLTQLIERQPILLEYIKELNLSHAHEWLTTNVEIIELLPRLSLKSLEIGGMDWGRLPPKLQSALYDRIVDPGLVALSLECIDNMDITALTNRHHLKELNIDEVCINNNPPCSIRTPWLPSNEYPVGVQGEAARLGRLEVLACGESLKYLLQCAENGEATLKIHRPEDLAISAYGWDDDMAKAVAVLLRTSASSVKEYSVREELNITSNPHRALTPPILFSFSRFTGLHRLEIWTSFHHFRMARNATFETVIEFETMSRSSHPIVLSSIDLDFQSEDYNPWGTDGLPDIGTRIRTVASSGVWNQIGNPV